MRQSESFDVQPRKNDGIGSIQTIGCLSELNPKLTKGLPRIYGRPIFFHLRFDTKHQAILLARHHVDDLLVRLTHAVEGHAGGVAPRAEHHVSECL